MTTEQDYQVTHEGEIYFVRIDEDGAVITVSDKDKNPVDLDEDVKETIANKGLDLYDEAKESDLDEEEDGDEEEKEESE